MYFNELYAASAGTANITVTTDSGKSVSVYLTVREEGDIPDVSFTDVTGGEYYYGPVLSTVDNGITTGIPNHENVVEFQPDSTCNRAQIVTFLYRAMNEQ